MHWIIAGALFVVAAMLCLAYYAGLKAGWEIAMELHHKKEGDTWIPK